MSVYQRPGVYVEETLNPLPPVIGADTLSIAAFIGAADRGPSTPTLVTSWSQYIAKFGGWNTINTNDLPMAVYLFFSNGGTNAVVSRVVDTAAEFSSTQILDEDDAQALAFLATSKGSWGNDVSIGVTEVSGGTYNVTVYYGGVQAANVVERFTDVSSDPASSRYVATVINGYSNYVVVSFASTTAPVSTGSSPVTMSGGLDGGTVDETAISTAVAGGVFDEITQSLVLNACGVTGSSQVGNIISYAEARGDVFVIVDPINDTVANQMTRAASYTASSQAAVYYPRVSVADPTTSVSGATTLVSPSGAIAGLYALTDASRGVFKAPAGLQARLAGIVSVAKLTSANLDTMNSASAPVNAIRYVVGSGIVVMGARTLKAGYVDRYVPTRRTLIYLKKALVDLTEFAIFEPNDQILWNRLNNAVSTFLSSFWREGGLKGETPNQAFFVKCDSDINTTAVIDSGEVRMEVGVALQRPAEFVVIKLGQYEGGATVTVA